MSRRKRDSRSQQLRRAQEPSKPSHNPPWVNPKTQLLQSPFERELSTKRRGEIAELAFALAAARRGFGISRPYGDCERYDVILDSLHVNTGSSAVLGIGARPRLMRVQVKATAHMLHGFHQVAIKRSIKGGGYEAYKLSEIDFIAAYIIPEDKWFIFPLPHVVGLTVLLLKPERSRRWHPVESHPSARDAEGWATRLSASRLRRTLQLPELRNLHFALWEHGLDLQASAHGANHRIQRADIHVGTALHF